VLQELDCSKASPAPEGEDFPGRLTAQPLAKNVSDPIQFLGGESTEPPHEGKPR
jgi:hypothetical protein